MRINNNVMAMNTQRQLGVAGNNGANSMSKLSSGSRINKAGDDAAGLAISEKMRGQIRGLNQASSNAQDGISLLQTAEGALNETHAILQRMRELAVQSGNDTNETVDRDAIQKEVNQLAEEITRIATTTEFNTQKLLDGNFTGKNLQIGANANQKLTLGINAMDATTLQVAQTASAATVAEASVVKVDNMTASPIDPADLSTIDVSGYTGTQDLDIKIKVTAAPDTTDRGVATVTINGKDYTVESDSSDAASAWTITVEPGQTIRINAADEWNADDEFNIKVTGRKEEGINVSNHTAAESALTTINTAINTVSEERSKLGAWQNRLEHSIKNLDTSAENMQAAESRIRDVDMAKEMMELTKNNILQQAAQAMLAQANQAPQGVLQLLR